MNSNLNQSEYLVAPDWNRIEAAKVVAPPALDYQSLRLTLQLDVGLLYLTLFAEGVRLTSESSRDFDYEMIKQAIAPTKLDLKSTQDSSLVVGAQFQVQIQHQPFSLSIFDRHSGALLARSATDGHFVRQHRVPPLAKIDDGWIFSMELISSEAIYGLGEKWGALNKRGQVLRSYNSDALGVNAEISYKNIPFAWSPEGWGVFVHTPAPVVHAVGHASWSQRSYCCLLEDDSLDILLFVEPRSTDKNYGAELISSFTKYTGRPPLPPIWSGGVILSKAYYKDPAELLAVAHEVRAQNMPCDTITIDGRAWQDTDTRFAFEWDKSRWRDPKKVIDELKQLDFKVCVWEYPLISVKHPWFQKFEDNGWLLKDKTTGAAYQYDWDQQAFGKVLTPLPRSGIVDFTHPDAYQFWLKAHRDLFEIGVDMIKADFGEQIEDNNIVAHNGESGRALHNVYSYLYNRCVFEAATKYAKSGPFIFSRAAWTGSQRYNSQWGGDPQADWEGMMGNIRGGLSWGLTGAPFYATDVGGFYKDTRDDDLYVRWAQAAVFSAHYRMHGIGSREPWTYSPQACEAAIKALALRYQLQAYLREAMQQACDSGIPVQRPMVLSFPNEKQSWSFENQFMFGDQILVVPCFDSAGRIEFYLPQGEWAQLNFNAETKEYLQGGRVYGQTLAMDEIAAFVRRGAAIPVNAVVENTDQLELDKQGAIVIDRHWTC